MAVSEYLETCMEQVRCKRMRPVLAAELAAHIEDQKNAYLAEGRSLEEAEQLAVEQMGDPVETGAAFDRVHRPRMDWKAMGMILAAAFVGVMLYLILYREEVVGEVLFLNFLTGTLIGLVIMAAVCFLDYTVLGQYPKLVWFAGIFITVGITLMTPVVNGLVRAGWLIVLLMPLFAGIVYHYRNQRYIGILKVLAIFGGSWILLYIFGSLDIGSMRWMFSTGCLGMLLFAVSRGWYQVPRKTALMMASFFLTILAAAGIGAFVFGGFKRQRLLAWLNPEEYAEGVGYVAVQMGTVRKQLRWVSPGLAESDWMQQSLEQSESHLFLGMLQCFGILACLIVVLFLAILCGLLLNRVWKVKNRLGAIVGFGCLFTIAVPLFLHLAVNLGWLPVTDSWMPFFSGGGKSCIAFYAVLGLLLSIFRNRDCAPEPDAKTDCRKGIRQFHRL